MVFSSDFLRACLLAFRVAGFGGASGRGGRLRKPAPRLPPSCAALRCSGLKHLRFSTPAPTPARPTLRILNALPGSESPAAGWSRRLLADPGLPGSTFPAPEPVFGLTLTAT